MSKLLQFYLRRRHAHLVVAGAVLQIAVNGVLRLGEAYLLDKRRLVFEEAQLHVSQLVELLGVVAARL